MEAEKKDCILLSCHTDVKLMTVVINQIVYINSHKECRGTEECIAN